MKYVKPSIATIAIILSGGALIAAPGNKADSNGDGILTQAESVAAAQARFERMDANGDGQINAADKDVRAAKRFAEMDGNGDGVISEDEFMASREARAAKREARRAEQSENGAKNKRAKKRDGQRNGKRGKRRGNARMLKRADVNGDNSVSREEFLAMVNERFAGMDINNDGQVTKAERQEARDKRKAQRAERKGRRQAK